MTVHLAFGLASQALLVAGTVRSVAALAKATKRPSALLDGISVPWSPGWFSLVRA